MAIKHFRFDRSLTNEFIRFGYDLYKEDKNWIPPLESELYQQLSPDYPFYNRSGNDHRHYLAMSGGKVVGRISAMVNSDLMDKDGTPVAILGFFECADDYEVAARLLDASIGWLHCEHGFKHIWGPMNFDIWHNYRFMTRGFDQRLFYGEPYNKPYYPGFFELYGFACKQLWDSVEISGRSVLEQMIARGAEKYRVLVERGYRFEPFNVRQFRKELRKLHGLLVKTFSGFLGFTKISFDEFEQVFSKSRYALNPQFFVFVYDEKNILAGFAVALLDLCQAIRSMKGKTNLISKLKFISERRHAHRINFYAGGMTPEEMTKMSGLGRAGFYYIIQQILNEGYEDIIIALRTKENRSRGLLGQYGKDIHREYALYELNL